MNYIYEAKEFLRNYKDYKIANQNLEDKLNKLNAELEGYKPIIITDMPHGTDSIYPDDKLCNMIFERDRVKECLEINRNKINEYERILNNLDDEYKKILIKSYIEELSEIEIIQELNMSRSGFYRKKNEAIRSLARQLFGIKVSGY